MNDMDVTEDEAALRILVEQQRKEIEEMKAAWGLVAAIIQTDANGKVRGIRHQEQDNFPPDELIPLYLCPQLSFSDAERMAIQRAADWLATHAQTRNDIHTAWYLCDDAAVLRKLLERSN